MSRIKSLQEVQRIDDYCESCDLYEDLEITEAEYQVKRDDPGRRANFRARHNCDNPGPKYKARYWSCYQWRAGAKVDN